MEKNLISESDHKDTICAPTVIADMFNKKSVNITTTVDGPSRQKHKGCMKKLDNYKDKVFPYSAKNIDVFNTVGNLKNVKAIGFVGVPTEMLKTLFPLNICFFEFRNLSSSRCWSLKCVKDAKINPSNKLG